MKVRSSLKLLCKFCKFIVRKGILRVKCDLSGRHNQRKGYCTTNCYCKALNSNLNNNTDEIININTPIKPENYLTNLEINKLI